MIFLCKIMHVFWMKIVPFDDTCSEFIILHSIYWITTAFLFSFILSKLRKNFTIFLKDPVTTHDIWKLAKFQKLQEGERERMYFKIYVRKPNPVRLVKVFVFTGHVWKRACCCYCQLLLLILTKFLLNI